MDTRNWGSYDCSDCSPACNEDQVPFALREQSVWPKSCDRGLYEHMILGRCAMTPFMSKWKIRQMYAMVIWDSMIRRFTRG